MAASDTTLRGATRILFVIAVGSGGRWPTDRSDRLYRQLCKGVL